MTEPRPLAHDLTDQGKYQLAHGEPSTTHTIVVLSDDDTIEPADGCTMEVWTTEYEDMDGRPGPDDGDLVASYNVAALPDLLEQLEEARQYVAKVATNRDFDGANIALSASRRLERMEAAIAKATGGAE